MSINKKCPKCGSTRVQLTNEKGSGSCLIKLIFGIYYILWVLIKWTIGLCILLLWDWWMAIIKNCKGKGYIWKCSYWFTGRKKLFYCHDCGYNFKA